MAQVERPQPQLTGHVLHGHAATAIFSARAIAKALGWP